MAWWLYGMLVVFVLAIILPRLPAKKVSVDISMLLEVFIVFDFFTFRNDFFTKNIQAHLPVSGLFRWKPGKEPVLFPYIPVQIRHESLP